MIKLVGDLEGSEYEAACELRESIARAWPDIADDRNKLDEIIIVIGGQIFGGAVQDLDLAVLLSLSRSRIVKSLTRVRADDTPYEFGVQHACILIEVKDHSKATQSVRFQGGSVMVRYGEKWHNATKQCAAQVRVLKALIENIGAIPPFVHGLVWLRNLEEDEHPGFLTNNLAGRELDWQSLLDQAEAVHPGQFARYANNGSAGQFRHIFDVLARTKEVTPLDRRRMDEVIRSGIPQSLVDVVGRKMLVLRGHAGSGKTATLLRLAYSLHLDQNAKVLILTYNRALVADLRRQLDLLGVPAAVQSRGIHVETVLTFFTKWLKNDISGVDYEQPGGHFDNMLYSKAVDECLKYVLNGAITGRDIAEAKDEEHTGQELSWTYVLVDEGQDSPKNERDLLRGLYDCRSIIVADGIDQLVRQNPLCDWTERLDPSVKAHIEQLPECRRMQSGLVDFCNAFASRLGLHGSKLKPSSQVAGGRIIVIEGNYFADRSLHDELRSGNAKAGNKGLDMLFCVPPSWVERGREGEKDSTAAKRLRLWNEKIWNGVSDLERIQFPLDVEQLRIVQYDSSRGLEGWVVVNFAFDDFFAYKYETWEPLAVDGVAVDKEQERHKFAAAWSMIPLTRAMETLVISVGKHDSPVKSALRATQSVLPEIVEWRTL